MVQYDNFKFILLQSVISVTSYMCIYKLARTVEVLVVVWDVCCMVPLVVVA